MKKIKIFIASSAELNEDKQMFDYFETFLIDIINHQRIARQGSGEIQYKPPFLIAVRRRSTRYFYFSTGYGLVIATHFHDDSLLSGLCPNALKANQKDRKH
jgi:hypothetical protein